MWWFDGTEILENHYRFIFFLKIKDNSAKITSVFDYSITSSSENAATGENFILYSVIWDPVMKYWWVSNTLFLYFCTLFSYFEVNTN